MITRRRKWKSVVPGSDVSSRRQQNSSFALACSMLGQRPASAIRWPVCSSRCWCCGVSAASVTVGTDLRWLVLRRLVRSLRCEEQSVAPVREAGGVLGLVGRQLGWLGGVGGGGDGRKEGGGGGGTGPVLNDVQEIIHPELPEKPEETDATNKIT